MVLMFGLASILLHVIHAQGTHSALIVCENNTSSIQCATSIVILSAVYGRTNNTTCPSEFIRTTQCESNTSFAIVNNSCTDRQKCTVYADNSYGDPCVNTYKYLNVSYQCSAETTTLSSTTKINTARPTTLSSTTNINTAETTTLSSTKKINTARPTTLFSTTKINTAKTTTLSSTTKINTAKTTTLSSTTKINTAKRTTLSSTTKINTDTQNITTDDVKISDISIPGIAVGVILTVLLAFSLAGVIIFLRRRSKLNKNIGNERIISENAFDYLGNQNIAMPDNETSTDYTELKIRINSHKYQDLKPKALPLKTLETSYDYIDTSQHTLSSKSTELPNVFTNGNSYLTRVPEDADIDPAMAVKNPKIYGHDYLVLDPNEKGFDESIKTATPSNESYAILDPTITGYNRSPKTLSEQNGYELAKPTCITEDKNKGTVKQAADLSPYGRTGTDYSTTNVQKRNQKSENIYSHAVDNVYDTTKHDRKEGQSDNTYDHFFGQKTEGDYDMAEKH